MLCLAAVASCVSPMSASSNSFGSSAPESHGPFSTSRPATPPARAALVSLPPELSLAIETRLAELERRGGVCSRYAEVLERSYRSGRIKLRPYMWRVRGHLVSGEARPNGEMILAQEIDSLNVGMRTIDDLVWTVEHEAAHIAFRLPSDNGLQDDRANSYVRACRSGEEAAEG